MSHDAPILLDSADAARAVGLTQRFLEARRQRGDGPQYVRVSSRCIRYRPEDLRAWAAERIRTSTSDDGEAV